MTREILENAFILAREDLEPIRGYLKITDGTIEEIGEGDPPEEGRDLNGSFVIPPFVNAHTHLGDSVKKDVYRGKRQEEVVGKEGEKFKALKEYSDYEKISAMKETLHEMKNSGTLAHCDFREEGMAGINLLNQAKVKSIRSITLTRPKPGEAIEEILSASDGIGFPSLYSYPEKEMKETARKADKMGKLISVHTSETKEAHEKSLKETNKTEIQRSLELKPSFLIHGTWASEEDLKMMKENQTPLVLCPRSNSLLSTGVPPIEKVLEEGVETWLGTDNVSTCPPVMFQELSYAWNILRLQSKEAGSREAKQLLKAATVNPTDDLGLPFGPLKEGNRASFVVLSRSPNLRRIDDPYVGIVNRGETVNVAEVRF